MLTDICTFIKNKCSYNKLKVQSSQFPQHTNCHWLPMATIVYPTPKLDVLIHQVPQHVYCQQGADGFHHQF